MVQCQEETFRHLICPSSVPATHKEKSRPPRTAVLSTSISGGIRGASLNPNPADLSQTKTEYPIHRQEMCIATAKPE